MWPAKRKGENSIKADCPQNKLKVIVGWLPQYSKVPIVHTVFFSRPIGRQVLLIDGSCPSYLFIWFQIICFVAGIDATLLLIPLPILKMHDFFRLPKRRPLCLTNANQRNPPSVRELQAWSHLRLWIKKYINLNRATGSR